MIRRIPAALLALALSFKLALAAATLDRAVCSTADRAGGDPAVCSGTELIDSATQEIAKLFDGNALVATSVAGTNAITATSVPAPVALTDGLMLQMKPAANNTAAVTFDYGGLGVRQVVAANGAALGASDLQASTIYLMRYYAANNEWRVLTPLGTGVASASAPYVTVGNSGSLSGERAITPDGTTITGTDGGANGAYGLSITNNGVTNAKLATMPAATVKCNPAGVSGNAQDCTATTSKTLLAITGADVANTPAGNITATTAQAAINELDAEKQPLDADLTALAATGTTGLYAVTGSGTAATRTLTAPAAGVTVTNGNGVAGNPTLGLANDLAAYEGLATNGIVARTATDAAATRTITGTANEITVTNGDGVAGNPTASLPTALTFTGKTVTGGTFSGPAIAGTGATFNGATSGTTTVAASAVASGALTLPAATDTLVGKATTDTLTNKSLSLGSNTVTTTSAQLATAVSDETGSGAAVFATSPALVTPNLGTPSAATLTNATGLPISTGISGLGTGVATALATPSSANLATAITDETGTGAAVFGTSPSLTTPAIGSGGATFAGSTSGTTTLAASATASGTLTLPATTGTLTALGNTTTGSGAIVLATSPALTTPNLGTPSAVTLTNGTGLPTTGLTGVLQAAQHPALTGDVTNTAGTVATTISAGVVSNSKLATMAASTIKGNNTAGVAAPADLTAAQTKTLLAIDRTDVANSVVPTTCSGTDKVSSIAANGAVTCSADAGGSGSGTPVSVNGTASAAANLNDTTPAAPAGGLNVKWQRTAGSPDSVSAYVPNAVQGPGSSTDRGIATWNGTTGATLQSNAPTITAGGTIAPIAGTATDAPLRLQAGTSLTTAANGAFEYDGTVGYFDHAASARGVIPATQFMRLTANYTLTSTTAAQKLFNTPTNGTFNVTANTSYRFKCLFALSGMSGSTGTFGFALGGTAAVTQAWSAYVAKGGGLNQAVTSATAMFWGSAANTAISISNASTTGFADIDGTINVTTAGTVIPQVSLSVAAAAVVQAGTYCELVPLGSNTVTTVGNTN